MLTPQEWTWVLEEIASTLEGAALQRVFEQDPDTWVLSLRQPGHTHMLLVSVAPDAARIHLTNERDTQPPQPTTLTMTMRKWLQGMRVTDVPQDHGDRLLLLRGHTSDPNFTSEDPDARPERVPTALVVECLGGRNNLFVLGADDRILAQQHRDALPDRGLRPGATYAPPPPPAERAEPGPGRFLGEGPRSERIAAWYAEHLTASRLETARQALLVDLRRERKRARRLVRNIEGDLERAERAASFRRFGELLQSAHGKVERGASSAHVPDYYVEGMPLVEIPLDPALDLKANIAHYFRQYRRLNDAQDRIEERLLEAMERVDALEAAQEATRAATSADEIHELRAQLSLRARQVQQRPGERGAPTRLPYREFRGGAGGVIYVGRGSKHNDELSLKVARGRDVWMHARDWAGAHVVLRMDRGSEPHQADMQDAALLAAHFSKGREDTLVDVTYTRAKYVKKPKGAPTGMVSVADGSTIGVRMDAERLAKVLATEQ